MGASEGIVGILLAAGRGSRFDPSGARNKLLQAWPAAGPAAVRSVVAASAGNLLSAIPRVIAVIRPGTGAVAAELNNLGCEVITCAQADTGMAASLVSALGHAADARGWIVALGDMPRVSPETIQSLKYALEQGAGIAAPMYRGKRGNPVGFSRQYLPQLLALQGDQGARGILKQYPVQEVHVDDAGILHDIDTPADLGQ
jgi:molybdenum cofactor cytidylyltransferase